MARTERPMARAARSKRWWRWPLYLVLGLVVLLALLFVALQTSFARERVRTQVNSALAQLFQGKIEIDRLGPVTPWGISGVDARVFDANGQRVIWARGLSVTAFLPSLGWQFLAHGDAPELYFSSIHVAHTEVTLREDADLGVTIASTFLPREPEPEAPTATTAPGSGPRLHIGQIRFDGIWAHGRAQGSPPLDAELNHLVASLWQSPIDSFRLELQSVDLVTRGLPLGADPRGNVAGIVESPANDSGPLRLELTLDGQAAASPLALEVSWVGDQLHAGVRAWRIPAAFVNRQAAGLALDGDLALVVDVDGPIPQLDFDAEIDGTAAHVSASGYAVITSGLELAASVVATRVNLARVAEGAPASELDFTANAFLLEQDDGHFVGSHRVDVAPGHIAGQTTPALWLTGKDELEPDAGIASNGKLAASEPSASLRGVYQVWLPSDPNRKDGLLATKLEAAFDEPRRLSALGIKTCGTATVSAEVRPGRDSVSGKAALELLYVDYQALHAQNIELQANAVGPISDPRLRAALSLEALSGRAHADLDYSAARQTLDVSAANLDLVRLLQTLDSPLPVKRAIVGLNAHLEGSGRSPRYRLNLDANADLGKLGAVKLLATDFELPSSSPSLTHLAALQGELRATGALDLEAVSPLITAAGLPIERTTGSVRFELGARHRRDDAQGLELSLQVDTNGLRVVQQRKTDDEMRTTADAIDSEPLALEGIDLRLSVHTWPKNGELVGTLILRDAGGTLLETQAEAELAGLVPMELMNVARLARVPLKATVEVPQRRLQSLPSLLRLPALRGRVALEASLDGSIADPAVKARLSLQRLRASGAKDPIDLTADVTAGFAGGDVKVGARLTRTQAELAALVAAWRGDVLHEGASALSGSADIKLSDFPLDVVPQIVDRQIDGRLSGTFKLSGWGTDAHVDADLRSTSLSVAKVPVKDFVLTARSEADKVVAAVELEVGSGTAKAALDADMRWGKRPLPELGHRGTAKLSAKAFKLETLSPLLGAYVSEIGGVLDANTEVTVTPGTTTLAGNAQLTQGVMQLPALGQRLSDINARVVVANNQFKIERFEARGTTGRLTVTGGARLDGFSLREAKAQVAIAKNEALPLTLEGEALGDAWGNVDAKFENPPTGERKLSIDLPNFHLVTPETSGHGLQSLDSDDDIVVGVRRSDGKFVTIPVQPLKPGGKKETASGEPAQPLRIQITLGNNVVVERGRTAQAQLTGNLTILSGLETEVSGRIELRGGKLDVSGKTFEIERGVITFEGNDPSNPTITATARWDAPGYTVYADYVGDVRNGRIKLHAEPPLTQDEIASLLLFGSPEGSGSGSDPNAASLAVSVAGDTATKGLNQVLDDFTNLDVSARVDTTTGSARPELVFQVSPRVSAKVTRAVGAPAAGESPDRTFLTLELRLRRAWALSAVFGDHGASALDLIWRRRY
ncbi:MAG: translocation/assembly module TamB domain-containing protein [Myxococcales bacterium]